MSRIALIVILIVLLLGALFFLSTVARERPTHVVEIFVPQGGNAR